MTIFVYVVGRFVLGQTSSSWAGLVQGWSSLGKREITARMYYDIVKRMYQHQLTDHYE